MVRSPRPTSGLRTCRISCITATRFVRAPRWRAELLAATAATLPREARADILRAALSLSLAVGDQDIVNFSLGSIGACLATTGEVPKALACIPYLLGWTLERHIPYWQAALVAMITAVVCLVAALVPAHRAARLDPAMALRYE